MGGPLLRIQGNVGPATGAVRHTGDVRIEGNLLQGGRVRADGDLHVSGHVTSSQLLASGSLTVLGIVSGTDTILDAIGRVTVRQVEDARILSGQDIVVLTAVERCRLYAQGKILIEGTPGLLRGGVARAGTGVTATRIEMSGNAPARIEIGGRVFDEDREELEKRLTFARKQTVQAKLRSGDSPEAYRRGLAGLRSYLKLARTLSHRVSQIRSDDHPSAPVLTVTGDGPVEAVLILGPHGLAGEPPANGPFEFGLTSDRPECAKPEEVACEQ